jgi:hypothetical protein
MFGSDILDIAVGLIFVYLLLALVCSAVNELIARIFALRSKTLEAGIRNLLQGKTDPQGKELLSLFYEHPLIRGLYRQGTKRRPSYIPARTFALALMDILTPANKDGSRVFEDIRRMVEDLEPSDMKMWLASLMIGAEQSIARVQTNIENWFDDAMDRVSGWYKRKAQLITLGVAFVVTIGLNVDTFVIANSLYRDSSVRAAAVTAAQETVKQPLEGYPQPPLTRMKKAQEELQRLQLPIGWPDPGFKGDNFYQVIRKLMGWIFTAFALSLGAPFWFDVLKKLGNLRSAGQKPEGTTEKSETGGKQPNSGS